MKKFIIMIMMLLSIFTITGCGTTKNEYKDATLDDDGNIVINEDDITSNATFVNYTTGGVTIQLIVVRASDGTVRVAFNTCQSCNPSPMAYFVQEGDYFVCQNCGTKFSIDEIGIAKGGCNPAPVSEKIEEEGKITISKQYVESYKEKFENWEGKIA